MRAKTNARGAVGRPPAHRAGEVDARILDAAAELFLAHGFEATSCEQVATHAGCGKASIYARYADKSELFVATIEHLLAAPQIMSSTRDLISVCAEVLEKFLAPEAVQLKRLLIAEATRFPEIVARADRVLRGRATTTIAATLPGGDAGAARLVDFVLAPLEMRALLGEPLSVLRAMVGPRIREAMQLLGDRAS